MSGSAKHLPVCREKQLANHVYRDTQTVTVSTAPMTTAEGCFSTLKRIKKFLRSTMSEGRESTLAILSIEKDMVNKILNFNGSVIDLFSSKKDRRDLHKEKISKSEKTTDKKRTLQAARKRERMCVIIPAHYKCSSNMHHTCYEKCRLVTRTSCGNELNGWVSVVKRNNFVVASRQCWGACVHMASCTKGSNTSTRLIPWVLWAGPIYLKPPVNAAENTNTH
ncbi:hypothetical protein PR048_001005, partial [Dryococelus australis]